MTDPAPAAPLVEVRDLTKHFRLPGGWLTGRARFVHAVDGVSLEVLAGETLGLVGESGCGKTTLGRMLLRLIEPTAGEVVFAGRRLNSLPPDEMRRTRREMQIVFQNPYTSLSPRRRILDAVAEPLLTHNVVPKPEVRTRVTELLEQVGLGRQHLDRFPHELSGGQCQRVALARALALQPRLIVLDEPTSALDVSVQAQIINLLDDLRRQSGLTYVFISHDLNVVHHISDRIGVMYLGKLVELGPAPAVFNQPLHPYTQALFSAIPLPVVNSGRAPAVLEGTVPSPVDPPSGCRFHTRCPLAEARCRTDVPAWREVQPGRQVACHIVS